MADFCSSCGSKVKGGDKFCGKCGSNIVSEKNASNTPSEASSSTKSQTKTLEHYLTSKSNQRSGFFGKKRKQEKTPLADSKKARDSGVVINVGRVAESENGQFKAVRGSKLSLKVCKDFNAKQVTVAAVQKHSNHDQYFLPDVEYVLLYPDHKLVHNVPGTDQEFTVALYKKELSIPYSKLVLYLCKRLEYIQHVTEDSELPKAKDSGISIPEERQDVMTLHDSSSDDDSFMQRSAFDVSGHQDKPVSSIANNTTCQRTVKSTAVNQLVNDCQPTTSACPVTALMRCPVCNLKFPLSDIEEHADICATARSTPFLCIPDETYIESEQEELEDDVLRSQADMSRNVENKSKLKHELVRVIKSGASMDLTQHVTLTVRRGFTFRDFHNFFSKSWNKRKQNHPYTVTFIGEAGLDTGGVSREFYSEALQEVKSQFFTGSDDQGYEPCCGLVSVADGTIHSIGHLFAASLCNNGPQPGFLAPWIYKYITGGVQAVLQSLPAELSEGSPYGIMYKELVAAKSDVEVSEIFKSDEALTMLEEIGYRGDPTKAKLENKNRVLQSMFIKARIEPLLTSLNEIMAGLTVYNILQVITQNVELFQAVFSPSEIFLWDHASFLEILKPQFSDEGSNRKSLEITTYKSFLDFTEACCYDDSSSINLGMLMKFITGSATVPCLGLPHDLKVEFIHDCDAKCKCLPTVSTCSICLRLPVHIKTDVEMQQAFDIAITSEIGFGRC